MEIVSKGEGRNLILELKGELDHHGAQSAIQQIEFALDAALPLTLTLDFSGVTFMDSSGIAVVLRTQRRMSLLGGSTTLRGIPPQAQKVFDAIGISRFVTVQ